uniref:Thioredoxin domain-containing protein n=1 Tax=Oryza barthii TaxID=65489 RepID=A0A0D3H9Z6_9ORYZ
MLSSGPSRRRHMRRGAAVEGRIARRGARRPPRPSSSSLHLSLGPSQWRLLGAECSEQAQQLLCVGDRRGAAQGRLPHPSRAPTPSMIARTTNPNSGDRPPGHQVQAWWGSLEDAMGVWFPTMDASSSSTMMARPGAVKNIESWDEFTKHFVKSEYKLVVLVFMAPWSEPWKLMRPAVEKMASGLKSEEAEVCTISVDRFNTLGRLLRVEALPTFVLVKRHRAVARVVGVNRDDLHSSINKHLAPPSSSPQPINIS